MTDADFTAAKAAGDQYFQSLFTSHSMYIPLKKLHPLAKLPTRAFRTDAGADVCALECTVDEAGDYRPLLPGERRAFRTGIAIAVPEGYYCRIAPRSGLAAKSGINVLAGVIDSAYRGEIKVVLHNTDPHDPVWIRPGDKIAQLIIEKCEPAMFVDVGESELEQSARAAGGFGSTGR